MKNSLGNLAVRAVTAPANQAGTWPGGMWNWLA
jgi:hypothetical protein